MKLPLKITDSTGGAVSATATIDDTTASVKDDLATLASAINLLIDIVKAQAKRIEELANA